MNLQLYSKSINEIYDSHREIPSRFTHTKSALERNIKGIITNNKSSFIEGRSSIVEVPIDPEDEGLRLLIGERPASEFISLLEPAMFMTSQNC
jgi:hypothetical protein